jgi:carboxyl-terminal processing protease
MDLRPRSFRAISLLVAAFLIGLASNAAWRPIARHFDPAPGAHAASAQENDRDQTYRLLALFGVVFERVRAQYVDPVSDKELVENAISGMLSGLDPHSGYMDAEVFREMQSETEGRYAGLGMEISRHNGFLEVVSITDNSPASKAGIKTGDIITAIDGELVQGLLIEDTVKRMRGPPHSGVTLSIRREGVARSFEVTMLRQVVQIQVVHQRMEPGNIGYVRLAEFNEEANEQLKNAIGSLQQRAGGHLNALVLDLRNNPGGLLDQAAAVTADFLTDGEIVAVHARHAEEAGWLGAKGVDILHGAPLVLLINGSSASASEIVAGALQDHRRGVLVGSRSFGKGSVQTVMPISDDGAIRLTTARYYTPSGRSIQGIGIMPDVPVAETREDVPNFGPQHEADLNRALKNASVAPNIGVGPRTDLPPIVKTIARRPPIDFPAFDPIRPDETDFQLQQALVVAGAMVLSRPTPH